VINVENDLARPRRYRPPTPRPMSHTTYLRQFCPEVRSIGFEPPLTNKDRRSIVKESRRGL